MPRNSAVSAIDIFGRFAENIKSLCEDADLVVTASCGIAEYSGQAIDNFIKLADHRLYEAKAKGKNCFVSE